jgi:hypothetical protein
MAIAFRTSGASLQAPLWNNITMSSSVPDWHAYPNVSMVTRQVDISITGVINTSMSLQLDVDQNISMLGENQPFVGIPLGYEAVVHRLVGHTPQENWLPLSSSTYNRTSNQVLCRLLATTTVAAFMVPAKKPFDWEIFLPISLACAVAVIILNTLTKMWKLWCVRQ